VCAASLTEAITAIPAQPSLNRVVIVEVAKTIFVEFHGTALRAAKAMFGSFHVSGALLSSFDASAIIFSSFSSSSNASASS